MKNLKEMSIEELKALNKEVEKTIVEKNGLSFWETIAKLKELQTLEREARKKKNDFEDSSKYISDFKAVGFSVVIYGGTNTIAFLDYSKDEIDGKYYAIEYSQETGELKPRRDDVSEGDIDTIKTILEMD